MSTRLLRCVRLLATCITIAFVLGSASDAHAINQMRLCSRFTTSYRDILSGQDYLTGSAEPATRHWAVVEGYTGQYLWSNYLVETVVGGNLYGCTPWLPIDPAPFHTLWVMNEVQVDHDRYIEVYPNTNNTYLAHAQTFNTPANPIGDSEFNVTFPASVTDHVSLVATRLGPTHVIIPPGSSQVAYTTYADYSGLSHTEGTEALL
jgi:hypothetical protein